MMKRETIKMFDLVLERVSDEKWFKFEYYDEDLNFPLEGEKIFPYKIK